MHNTLSRGLFLTLMICAAGIVGCKAAPAKSAGFADPKLMKADPNIPFNKYWEKPGLERMKYTKLYVAPVNTAYMLKITDWQKGERKNDLEKDVQKLGEYARNSVKKAFKADKNKRFEVVDTLTPNSDTLVFEIALVEVVPSKVTLNALGYAPFFIGTTISVVRSIAQDVSTTAFEARIRDAATNEVVGLMADREAQQTSVVSARGLTWYRDAEFTIDQWAEQFVKVANRKGNEKIKDTDTFTLLPW